MKKQLIALGLGMSMIATALAGCGGDSSGGLLTVLRLHGGRAVPRAVTAVPDRKLHRVQAVIRVQR